MNFEQACLLVLDKCPNDYAKAYAKAGLDLGAAAVQYGVTLEKAQAVQALYILNNMQTWRGATAKAARAALKLAAKKR